MLNSGDRLTVSAFPRPSGLLGCTGGSILLSSSKGGVNMLGSLCWFRISGMGNLGIMLVVGFLG